MGKIDYPVDTLLDTKFVKVFDLRYAEGRHYYNATRREKDRLVADMQDREFQDMTPDAVSCCVIWHEENGEKKLLLNREYRYPLGQYVISVPAGLIDPEDQKGDRDGAIITAARREIHEETGIILGDQDKITIVNSCLFSTPGLTDESNAMVRIDVYGHSREELTQNNADATEKFEGFLMLNRDEAEKIMMEERLSTYTWIGLSIFLYQ